MIVRRFVLSSCFLLLTGCAQLGQLAWQAADQAGRYSAERLPVDGIIAPTGFRAVRIVNGLNFPSAFTWDGDGNIYILESHTVPAPMLHPKIVRVMKDGRISRVEWRGPNAPTGGTAIGLTFHDGWLYFSHEQKDGTFAISRVRPAGGDVERVLGSIPVQADHDVNHLVFDDAGTLYFGVGSATNSGVVAADDAVNQKWLAQSPAARDIPCREIRLTGQTFTDKAGTTGAYQALGQSGATTLAGEAMCTSAVYRLRAGATTPELMAWGFRNPVGLALDGSDLLIANQGADVRSTRPIANDPDSIFRIREGAWFGWPDFSASLEPVTDAKYASAGTPPLRFVIDHAASGLTAPDRSLLIAALESHAAVCGMTIGPGRQILVAEMGDFKPMTSPDSGVRAGFQIESIDQPGGNRASYLRNRNDGDPQPSSTLDLRNGLERPVDVRIGPDGLVYVLDFGAFVTTGGEPKAFPKTGKLFRIERE